MGYNESQHYMYYCIHKEIFLPNTLKYSFQMKKNIGMYPKNATFYCFRVHFFEIASSVTSFFTTKTEEIKRRGCCMNTAVQIMIINKKYRKCIYLAQNIGSNLPRVLSVAFGPLIHLFQPRADSRLLY